MNEEFYSIVSQICQEDPRYHTDSYEFVMEALSFARKKFKCAQQVSGYDFLEGIKGLGLKKFGPMTIPVLDYWGIKRTEDFGNIVSKMVQYKIIAKDAQDHYEAFKDGYDFHEVFDKGYRQQLAKRIKAMRF